MGISHETSLFATASHGCKKKYPLQPWLWLLRIFFSFATVTDGCKEQNFMGFSQFIYENELSFENMYLPMILAKKKKNHFSFFKVDSQNPKYSLEYVY